MDRGDRGFQSVVTAVTATGPRQISGDTLGMIEGVGGDIG
jgi:hypothetical protein